MAMELLLDPEVDLVTLIGQAGTGKTLLARAIAGEAGVPVEIFEPKKQPGILVIGSKVVMKNNQISRYLGFNPEEKEKFEKISFADLPSKAAKKTIKIFF